MATKSVSDAERIASGLHVFQYKSISIHSDCSLILLKTIRALTFQHV